MDECVSLVEDNDSGKRKY